MSTYILIMLCYKERRIIGVEIEELLAIPWIERLSIMDKRHDRMLGCKIENDTGEEINKGSLEELERRVAEERSALSELESMQRDISNFGSYPAEDVMIRKMKEWGSEIPGEERTLSLEYQSPEREGELRIYFRKALICEIESIKTVLSASEHELYLYKDRERLQRNRREERRYLPDFVKKEAGSLLVVALMAVGIGLSTAYLMNTVKAAAAFQALPFQESLFTVFFLILFPFATFLLSTCFKFWRHYPVKTAVLDFCGINLGVVLGSVSERVLLFTLSNTILPQIKPNGIVSGGEIILYLTAAGSILSILLGSFVSLSIIRSLHKDPLLSEIRYFRLDRFLDLRKNKEFLYDQSLVVKTGSFGKRHVVRMHDRFLHSMVDGATGTGKTSLMVTNAVRQDLDRYVHNQNYQKESMYRLLREGRVRLSKRMDDEEFSIRFFEPIWSGNEREDGELKKELRFLMETSTICGIMVEGPNDGFLDPIYEMAKSRGIRNIYRVDPVRVRDGVLKGNLKEDFYGYNPLAVPDDIDPMVRDSLISSNAQNVTDTLNILNKTVGSVDSYFEGVNSTQTLNISILMMLVWKDLYGVQPTLDRELELLNDFEKIRRPLYRFVQLYGNGGSPIRKMEDYWDIKKYSDLDAIREFGNFISSHRVDCGKWQIAYDVFVHTLLDKEKGPVQYDRANGLRNQFQSLLLDDRVRTVLCSQKSVNYDKVLKEGGVILFNYALEIGETAAGTLGRFFTFAYSKAVLRRDTGKFMIPFFTYIDEFPTVLNSSMEEMFTLHRQYRNANMVVLQTLMQMEKSQQTKYFKILLMTNTAHQYLFGRQSVKEMQDYEILGGERLGKEIRESVSHSALSVPDPSYSESQTVTGKPEPVITGSDIRYNDFKELTVFTVDNGCPVKPFKAEGEFITDYEKKAPPLVQYDWSPFWPEDEAVDGKEADRDMADFVM